ncbi:MAG: NYN domain-containing protein [Candidatus Omnitrophota bacterium]
MMKALVVDGYNAIHKIPHLRTLMDKSLLEARDRVTRLSLEYQRRVGGIDKIRVVFDGKDIYRDKEPLASDAQVFSKTGEGDDEILRQVRILSEKYHVLVVTDDNFVRNNSRAHKASVISVSRFIEQLDKKEKKRAREMPAGKVSPESALKINEELKRHWGL